MHDVIVVGAGFTGLSAATEFMKAGLDVLALEARGRVGGRVEAEAMSDGRMVDTGGQFFCRDMTEVVELARHFGRRPVMSYDDGDMTAIPPASPERIEAIWEGVDHMRDRMIAVDLNDPAIADLTVSQWLAQQTDVPDDVAEAFCRMVKGLWCRSPDELSFRYLSSNDRRIVNTHPELEMFLGDTMHALADDLGKALGDRLRLDAPVKAVRVSPEGVTVTVGNEDLTARRLVLAMPPIMANRLSYAPPLSQELSRALDAWSPGMAMKFNIRYAKPFWRDKGLNGKVMWNRTQGLFACDAGHGDYTGLIVFVGGPLAGEWHDHPSDGIRDFVLHHLAEALGEEARDPLEINLRDWVDDAWSDGAYSDVITKLDAPDAEAIMTDGAPPIHFACSELASTYPGYIEGAIRAGKAVAHQIIRSLASRPE